MSFFNQHHTSKKIFEGNLAIVTKRELDKTNAAIASGTLNREELIAAEYYRKELTLKLQHIKLLGREPSFLKPKSELLQELKEAKRLVRDTVLLRAIEKRTQELASR